MERNGSVLCKIKVHPKTEGATKPKVTLLP